MVLIPCCLLPGLRKPADGAPPQPQQQQQPGGFHSVEVRWAVNDWESGSDASEQPDEDMADAHVLEACPGSSKPCVLLPWDME